MVFNAALFDFHPETWVMPAFALALWAEREGRPDERTITRALLELRGYLARILETKGVEKIKF